MGVAFIAHAFITNLPRFHVLYADWHAFFKHFVFNTAILCILNYCPCNSPFPSPLSFLKAESSQ